MGLFDFIFNNDETTEELPKEVVETVSKMSPRDTRLATASLDTMQDKLGHLKDNFDEMEEDDIKAELIGALENFNDAIQIIECYSEEDEEE